MEALHEGKKMKKKVLTGSIDGLPLILLSALDRHRYARSVREGRTVGRAEAARDILALSLVSEVEAIEREVAR